MANFKHKVFLLIAKWIPVAVAAGILINNTLAINAQYHDNINLYEKWFPNATNNEIEDKIVEATISNWFEDEDASSDKVWEYFRVI